MGIEKKNFEKIVDGKPVELFILRNQKGMEMSVINYGAKIVSLLVPDQRGQVKDVVLGKNSIEEYLNDQEPYFGAICGRTANRIADGRFTLEGVEYVLVQNNAPNSLHGGPKGFHAVVWDAYQPDEQTLQLSYLSKEGEEGFPGNLKVKVVYRLTEENALEIDYEAATDKTTLVNLTNHAYFNLSGEGDPSIEDHVLQIQADSYLPINAVAIPLGNPEKVAGTPFDLRSPHAIGEQIGEDDTQLLYGKGYDHNFVLNPGDMALNWAAKVVSPKTGIEMDIYTTEPGIQLYTGNFLDGSFTGKNGHIYPFRSAFCLETQHFPDSIHHPDYPETILRPGETFRSKTVYAFTVV
ncbi:MAG: galactose mutarotase [Candidatus Azobacteroides sp.]|nr:galactose mutarotase [Candidatus Azobacteroides sp.]